MVLLLFGAAMNYSASAQQPGPQWTVTGSMGAHHTLVVNVTARPSVSLHDIGEAIVNPGVGQYAEILCCVRGGKSPRRGIQWTPQHGYVGIVRSSRAGLRARGRAV